MPKLPTLNRRQLMVSSLAAASASLLPVPALAEAMATAKLGDFKISIFSDGSISLPATFPAPSVDYKKRRAALAKAGQTGDTLTSPLNVTLVESSSERILIDVGSGTRFVGTAGKLEEALADHGIAPEQITKVVYTHAHPDHIWGTLNDFDELAYPNAEYYISEAEWNFWMDDGVLDKLPADRKAFGVGAQRQLKAAKAQIKTVKPGQELVPGIALVDTAGHTPGHMSVEVGRGADRVLVLGDALTHPIISFQHPTWQPASDQMPERAIKTRQSLLDRLAQEKLRIIGYHLPNGGMGWVERRGVGYRFVSL